jgi:Tfp pilus assembly protein PilF
MDAQRERARKLFERALECQQEGDLEGAIQLYQASIAAHPTAEAHTFLGWVYSFGHRYHDAIRECKRAISVDPTFGNPYNDIGSYLVQLGQDDDAVPWFYRAMDAPRYEAPHFPHLNLAKLYERRGDAVRALSELTKADQKMPEVAEIITEIRRLQGRVN